MISCNFAARGKMVQPWRYYALPTFPRQGETMKWFKHDTDANQDAKLQNVLLDYGLEGYGLYWYCIELITGKVDQENITFQLEHDARIIARNTGCTPQKVEEMMRYFVDIGLFENSQGVITCLKLAKRLDKSMTSSPKMRSILEQLKLQTEADSENVKQQNHDGVMTESCRNHDGVMTESCKNRSDQNRSDQIREDKSNYSALVDERFERVWTQWPSKVNKKKARDAFVRYVKKSKVDPVTFSNDLLVDISIRCGGEQLGFDKMHLTTYINGERWNDAKPQPAGQDTVHQAAMSFVNGGDK